MTVHTAAPTGKVHHAHPSLAASKAPAAQTAAAAAFGGGPAATVSLSPKAQQLSAPAGDKDHDGDAK